MPTPEERLQLRAALLAAGGGDSPTRWDWERWRSERRGWPSETVLRRVAANAAGVRTYGHGQGRAGWADTLAYFGLKLRRRRKFPRDTTMEDAKEDVLRVSRELGYTTEVCGYREYESHPTKSYCAETVKKKLGCRSWRHVQVLARPDGFREWEERGSALEGWRT